MDFFQIIRSLENLLYEAMTWLIFYPRTLWRCVVKPDGIMAYTVEELRDTTDDRFSDLLSPPLYLMLSLLIAHALEKTLGVGMEEAGEMLGETGRMIVGSEQNLLLFRSFVFALFPLVTSVGLIRRKGIALDRNSLKGPFYQQCYFGGTYGLVASTASAMSRHALEPMQLAGIALALLATLWYLWVQTRWIQRELGVGGAQAAGLSLWFFLLASTSGAVLGLLILRS